MLGQPLTPIRLEGAVLIVESVCCRSDRGGGRKRRRQPVVTGRAHAVCAYSCGGVRRAWQVRVAIENRRSRKTHRRRALPADASRKNTRSCDHVCRTGQTYGGGV